MQVFRNLKEVTKNNNTYLTIGTFDGLHLGHQKIIKELLTRANANAARDFVVTFDPHPRVVLGKETKLLTTLDEKLTIFEALGVNNILVINFTKEFASIDSKTFILDLIKKQIGVAEIILGYDHQFGKGREGNAETLKRLGSEFDFRVDVIGPVISEDEPISSTKIRKALNTGNLDLANRYLNRDYQFEGTVIEGDKRGRTLGFPTANIKVEVAKLLPMNGIYAGTITVDEDEYDGVMSIGKRPTFYDDAAVLPEFFVFDFNSDIYFKNVKIKVKKFIREELKFENVEQLVKRMNEDCTIAKDFLKK